MKYTILLILTISSLSVMAQTEEYPYPSLSPKGQIMQMVGTTKIEVEYERPCVRNRDIFGGLVPWNKVWRTGAGHCTKIKIDKPVVFGGQQIKAGTYSLFTIPNPNKWIVILNTDTTLYGSYNYKIEKDVARFVVRPKTANRYYEALTIDIDIIPNNARMYISWENTQIAFDILTTTDADLMTMIDEELKTNKSTKTDNYAGAAEYFYYKDINLLDAIKLADKAIVLDEKNGWARRLKIEIYERLEMYELALEEIKKMIAVVKIQDYAKDQEIYRVRDIENLEKHYRSIEEKMKK